ncbi:MAG: hypothetical protein CL912_12970 [Deltaproteobacteria bacterium]|nr:hypothetical protein [Deltaproteobacteria bacterium]
MGDRDNGIVLIDVLCAFYQGEQLWAQSATTSLEFFMISFSPAAMERLCLPFSQNDTLYKSGIGLTLRNVITDSSARSLIRSFSSFEDIARIVQSSNTIYYDQKQAYAPFLPNSLLNVTESRY